MWKDMKDEIDRLCLNVRFKTRENLVYTLKLSHKSGFQPSTKKQDNIGHPNIKTVQI